MSNNFKKGTICVQGGYSPKAGEPRVLPIYQSVTYKFDDPSNLEDLFSLQAVGHLYSRISNPTVAGFEERFAQLQGGIGAVATSSGQAAILYSIINICKSGDHIIASSSLYGGTVNLFKVHLKNLGIEVSFVSPEASKEEILSAAKENTKAIYGETIGNPELNILDFEKFAETAKILKVPFIVDNTVASPYLCNPFEHGANIVIHSTTKYADGHAQSIGGIVVDGGNFDWSNGKFEDFTTPDPSYHGLVYTEAFKEAAYITKLRVTIARDFGACLSPFNAYITNLGLETLHLRIERHSQNALSLAKWLEKHPKVKWVNYPYLETSKEYEKAKKYLNGGGSGLLTFGLDTDIEGTKRFQRALKLISLAVTLGDTRSCILHPATTTHSQLSEKELEGAGVTTDLLRISIGIEDIEDIIKDVEQALEAV
ncbi:MULTISPECIES: O-acetylhomoserine aminocarboxypropyltransferase/cysteine synthase family protein [Eubacteriales]|uniref:O-acetylhomoserine aminocarboxypropyltransferase n=1 Tax=Clostridium isatidis TaxID=182773 RepID=A0A343J9P9_9CLOT|nr:MULTISPECIES: O-acetylhomoserine aminocarboxypropyltransferase/cysteine synthase family protein [Eubacteriales]ASW42257.1 O-acetylhomoserine aminocarboxypropyltransferase [Clostridium isatidis]MBU5454447.1 O-acetylhomoserine aminocarboxypropyltransferase/cysteine synthase [Caproiciproducens sp. MSJ-32]NLZ33425.1 O-acetylhomoserine aminocarboxypropyltransferase/cysteine synthase [Clostridiales bacterium]